MEPEKTSRSGRQVKIPLKFAGMEIVDAQGRRSTIPNPVDAPKGLRLFKNQSKPPYLGKKRGRPSMRPPGVTSQISTESAADMMVSPDNLTPEESEQIMAQLEMQARSDFEEESMELGEQTEHVSLISAEASARGTPPTHDSGISGVQVSHTSANLFKDKSLIHRIIEAKHKETGAEVNPRPVSVTSDSVNIDRKVRRQKGRLGDEETEAEPIKRRRIHSMKNVDFDIDLPPGLLEAMRKKRNTTAYLAFCRAERPAVMQENPSGDFGSHSRALGSRWMSLSAGEKDRWRKISQKIASILAAEQPGVATERERVRPSGRDRVIRNMEQRLKDPEAGSAFDLVANYRIVGEQLATLAEYLSTWQVDGGSPATPPAGCLDVLMDTAFVAVGSALALVGQVPVWHGVIDKDILDDIAETAARVMPLVSPPPDADSKEVKTVAAGAHGK